MIRQDVYKSISPLMNHAYRQKKWFEKSFKPLCKKYGLKHSELSILIALHVNQEIKSAVDIEKFSELKRGNISVCIDVLCKRGFVKQVPVANDRRFKHLMLLEDAEVILEKADEVINYYANCLFEGITQEECAACNAVFHKMDDNLKKLYEKEMEEK